MRFFLAVLPLTRFFLQSQKTVLEENLLYYPVKLKNTNIFFFVHFCTLTL